VVNGYKLFDICGIIEIIQLITKQTLIDEIESERG